MILLGREGVSDVIAGRDWEDKGMVILVKKKLYTVDCNT